MDHFYGIYGVGAVIIIETAQYFNKNNFSLFIGGYVMGSIIEYLISFLVEVFLNTKWWDYSNNILNINGRICLLYSVFWGILSIVLVKKFNPIIDKLLSKMSIKFSGKMIKAIISFIIVFLLFDCIATCYAQDLFVTRMAITNGIELSDIRKKVR